jgi:hypothetical protein
VPSDEVLEVAIGDTHNATEVVRNKLATLYPAANCPLRHSQQLRYLGDGKERGLTRRLGLPCGSGTAGSDFVYHGTALNL